MSAGSSTWYVYIVRCRDRSLYCGSTNDVPARVAAHNAGTGARYTRSRLPVRLAFCREMGSKPAALREEARIKALTRAEKLRLIDEPSGLPQAPQ